MPPCWITTGNTAQTAEVARLLPVLVRLLDSPNNSVQVCTVCTAGTLLKPRETHSLYQTRLQLNLVAANVQSVCWIFVNMRKGMTRKMACKMACTMTFTVPHIVADCTMHFLEQLGRAGARTSHAW